MNEAKYRERYAEGAHEASVSAEVSAISVSADMNLNGVVEGFVEKDQVDDSDSVNDDEFMHLINEFYARTAVSMLVLAMKKHADGRN